jgi:MFS family permease
MSSVALAAKAPSRRLSTSAATVLALGALDFGLEQSIIVPALPSLAVHYGASIVAVAWLATGFLLAAAVAVPLFGRLGDLLGKKRMILVSLGAFAVGSLVCALSSSIGLAIAGRALQGFGAAVAPLTLGLARDFVAPQDLPRVVGVVIGAANVGGGVGFLVSGLLVDAFSPAAIFWFLFIVGAVLAIAVALFAPETPLRAHASIDPVGVALLGIGLVALLLALSEGTAWGWSSAAVLSLFATCAVTLALFAATEWRLREPLVDLRLVATRPFLNANLCMFAFGFAFFVAVFVIPQIAASPEATGYGLGLSVTEIGLLLVPTSVAGLIGGWSGGRTLSRLGPRAQVSLGALIGVAGYLSLALAHDTAFALASESAAIGLAWGLILTGIYPVVLRTAGADKTSIAAAVVLVFRNTGVSVGVTVSAVVIAGAGLAGPFRDEAGFTRAFLVAAGGAVAAFLLAAWLPQRVPGVPGLDGSSRLGAARVVERAERES